MTVNTSEPVHQSSNQSATFEPTFTQKATSWLNRNVFHAHANIRDRDFNPFNLQERVDVVQKASEFPRSLIPSIKSPGLSADSIRRNAALTAKTTGEQNEFTRRVFVYFTVKVLESTSCIPPQGKNTSGSKLHLKIADQASKNNFNFWAEFKAECWNKMTITQKVKAFVIYHIFGDIIKTVIEDFTGNVMTFVREKYSTKRGINNFFKNFLSIIYNFLSNYRNTAEISVNPNQSATRANLGSNFIANLEMRLRTSDFLRTNSGLEFQSEEELHNSIITKLIERFLPKLRLKEIFLSKLDYKGRNLNGWSKVLYLPKYLLHIVAHLPLLLLACALESTVNCKIKDWTKGKLTPIVENLKSGWNENYHEYFLQLSSDLLDKFQKNSNLKSISRTRLDDTIKDLIKGVVQEFLVTLDISLHKSDINEISRVLKEHKGQENQFKAFDVDAKVRAGLIQSFEDALLFFFSAFINEDQVESYFYKAFKMLNTTFSNANKKPSRPVSKREVLNKTKKAIAPFIEASVNHSLGSGRSQGTTELARFFNDYRKQQLSILTPIRSSLESALDNNSINTTILNEALVELNRHRDQLIEMSENFERYAHKYPIAADEVSKKLYPIAEEQHRAFTSLVEAKENYHQSISLAKANESLHHLSDLLDDVNQFSSHLSDIREAEDDNELYEQLSTYNDQRLRHFESYNRLTNIYNFANERILSSENSLIAQLCNYIIYAPEKVTSIRDQQRYIKQSFSFQFSNNGKNYSEVVGNASEELVKLTATSDKDERTQQVAAAVNKLQSILEQLKNDIYTARNEEFDAQNKLTEKLRDLIEEKLDIIRDDKKEVIGQFNSNVKQAIETLTSLETVTSLLKENAHYSLDYTAASVASAAAIYCAGSYLPVNLLQYTSDGVAQVANYAMSVLEGAPALAGLSLSPQLVAPRIQGMANGYVAPLVHKRTEAVVSFLLDNKNLNTAYLVLAQELNS